MKKILMVCLGNICRSPLAEGILKSKIDPEKIFVDSAGTAGYHIGELPDPRSVEIAGKYHIDITGQRARNKEDMAKVSLILNQSYPNQNREVPDSCYGGSQGFEHVYIMLDEACEILKLHLKDER
ncbi:MAG: low molecular weight phosphotyrosine protein phosphatase [Flavobacteriaceae bacterium]|nr:MAG: low molecular weight phosphotyrosine protein phosphatase [Flavobacteriaceae bacterium]